MVGLGCGGGMNARRGGLEGMGKVGGLATWLMEGEEERIVDEGKGGFCGGFVNGDRD